MDKDTIISFSDPALRDELTDLVRDGARRMLREALTVEVDEFCAQFARELNEEGQRTIVRNGYLQNATY